MTDDFLEAASRIEAGILANPTLHTTPEKAAKLALTHAEALIVERHKADILPLNGHRR